MPFRKNKAQRVSVGSKKRSIWTLVTLVIAAVTLAFSGAPAFTDSNSVLASIPNLQPFPDPSGAIATFSSAGAIDQTNPFFQELGTNGRRCVTCHEPSDAFSVTPPHIEERFEETQGTDPIFRPVDGANCPTADVSTVGQRRRAYSLLLTRGLIRIGISVPANADYQVVSVYNPYGCNETDTISMYRRPLPTTNLPFLSAVMFDGRETTAPDTTKIVFNNYPTAL